MAKTVLVTGIGGNVGQGILESIIASKYPITIIGTDTKKISAGNHFCDKVYDVPFSTHKTYAKRIVEICNREKIDLIIPSTDYETYYLAYIRDDLPILSSSPAHVAKKFLDKYETAKPFQKVSIPFAKTFLPSEYTYKSGDIIVKPREGRGSRSVSINPQYPKKFDDTFVVQELYKGVEITTCFYVTREKKLLGNITFKRSLQNGYTDTCEVTFDYDQELKEIIEKIVKNFDIHGSCNIQSIVTEDNTVVPFEVNCRISGTCAIRSQFGFEDVKYTLQEYLYKETPEVPTIKNGSALRILLSVIYPNTPLDKVENKNTKHYIF